MKSQWDTIAETRTGNPYGHVPGHKYHDVSVVIDRRGSKIRVEVTETWGSSQGRGRDEEHARNRVIAIDDHLDVAVRIASARAKKAGIDGPYLVQALSAAHAEAMDVLLDDEVQK